MFNKVFCEAKLFSIEKYLRADSRKLKTDVNPK